MKNRRKSFGWLVIQYTMVPYNTGNITYRHIVSCNKSMSWINNSAASAEMADHGSWHHLHLASKQISSIIYLGIYNKQITGSKSRKFSPHLQGQESCFVVTIRTPI